MINLKDVTGILDFLVELEQNNLSLSEVSYLDIADMLLGCPVHIVVGNSITLDYTFRQVFDEASVRMMYLAPLESFYAEDGNYVINPDSPLGTLILSGVADFVTKEVADNPYQYSDELKELLNTEHCITKVYC